jgi:hypothetical protein
MPEEHGYMPEECAYMPEERGYMPEELGYMLEKRSYIDLFWNDFSDHYVCLSTRVHTTRVAHILCSDQFCSGYGILGQWMSTEISQGGDTFLLFNYFTLNIGFTI